jgi:hypothetical protein
VLSRFATGAVVIALLGSVPVAASYGASTNPTPAQLKAAVQRAERSRQLWATVNICNTRAHPHTIGIRGQMPALGYTSTMSMAISIDYLNPLTKRYVPDRAVMRFVPLGDPTLGLWQGGVRFSFKKPSTTVVLRGMVTFQWKRSGKLVGSTIRYTVHGIKHVDDSDPPGYSTATCQLS